jgi:hypothetical protein
MEKKAGTICQDEFNRRYRNLQDEITELEFEVYNLRLRTDVKLDYAEALLKMTIPSITTTIAKTAARPPKRSIRGLSAVVWGLSSRPDTNEPRL